MTKYLLISIQPQHVYNILIGKKTLELRKMIPKWVREAIARGETVIVLIYCTKRKPYVYQDYTTNEDGYTYLSGYGITDWENEVCIVNGKIVAQFELNKIDDMIRYAFSYKDKTFYETLEKACITVDELKEYLPIKITDDRSKKHLYAIHISNLKVFDKPKELRNYYKDFAYSDTDEYGRQHNPIHIPIPLERAPQNMMAVWGD